MDSWTLSWQSAAAKAKEMAAAVQESTAAMHTGMDWQAATERAKAMASQLQENTKVLAERAQTVSTAAEQKLKEMNFNESLATLEERLNDLSTKLDAEAQQGTSASEEELQAFGINPDFMDFVRFLNYSTFRDFPDEHLQPLHIEESGAAGGAAAKEQVLTPWQARHATLVCQSVKEINELRFVLCPRRMSDARFWTIYFSLAKKHLPRKAYGMDTPLPQFEAVQSTGGRATLTADSAKATLEGLSSRLRSTLGGFGLAGGGLGIGTWGGNGASSAGPSGGADGAGFAEGEGRDTGALPSRLNTQRSLMDADPDLEEYLKVAAGGGADRGEGEGSGEGEAEGDEDEDGEGGEVDLDDYLQELQEGLESDEDEAAGGDGADGDDSGDYWQQLEELADNSGEEEEQVAEGSAQHAAAGAGNAAVDARDADVPGAEGWEGEDGEEDGAGDEDGEAEEIDLDAIAELMGSDDKEDDA